MFPKKYFILILLSFIILAGCGKHQKLVKSSDNEAKYAAAMDYYEKKDYYRALQLFQQLVNFYQGTEKAEKMQFYYAYCYYHQGDYVLASYYFKRFASNYPRSQMAEEAMFMNAYCYFLDSPTSSLDQTNTFTAIKELQLFIDLFPESARVEEATTLINQLRDKLQRKDFDIANLYLKMGLYEAAIKSYQNVLKEYPDTDFKEDILFDILKSYYNYAGKSISHKQTERYQSALDSYNEFAYSFPDSKYMKEAKNMRRNVLAALEEQGAASSQNNNKQ